MNCQSARRMLHRAMDDDLALSAKRELEGHLQACCPCQAANNELTKMASLLERMAEEPTPNGFTAELMNRLPATRPRRYASTRTRAAFAAAIIFILVAAPLFLHATLSQPQLVADDWQAIRQEGDRFIVPEGAVVQGDVVIYKGVLEIQGEVRGTIKVVDAEVELGPEGKHAGLQRSIDPSLKAKLAVAMGELWERIRHFFGNRP